MNNMKLIMENWRSFQDLEQWRTSRLSNPEYITEVLGIQIPLVESYPYSPIITEEILKEQQLYEQWWFGSAAPHGKDILDEGALRDWWEGTKEKIASYPETLRMLYRATSDPIALRTFTRSIKRKGMGIKNRVLQFLNSIITKASGFQNVLVQKLVEWASSIKEKIGQAMATVESLDGWKKALALVATSVGLSFVWSKIAAYVQDLLGCGDEEEEETKPSDYIPDAADSAAEVAKDVVKACIFTLAKKFAKDAAFKLARKTAEKVAGAAAAVYTMGASKFWQWLTALVKGVKFVVKTLRPVLQMFKGRGGMSDERQGIPTPAPA